MLEAGIDPLSPDNLLIAATGPLTGTLCPSSGSVEFCFKSPLTGIFGESRAGGSFGPRLKFAGYDLIVVRGRSEKPVYLHIRDRYAELRDASHLWGKNVHEATDILLRDLAEPDASVACIGQAGENLVRFASIMVDYDRAAGRCGGGAVMGAKRLKAVVVDGHGEISAAKPDEFFDAALEAINVVKARADKGMGRYGTLGGLIRLNESGALPTRNFKTCYFEEAEKVSGQTLSEKYLIKKRACFGCPIGCGRYIQVPAGDYRTPPHEGAEYETVDMLGVQSMIGDLEAIIKAGYLCNIYGLDTISAGNVIAFAIEAYERGIITEEDAGGIRLRWGDPGVTLALIEKIVKKEGIGRLLAEGVKRASEKLGKGSEEFACHGKGLEIPAHDPRGTSKSLAIQYAVGNPRGACHIEPIWSPMWDFSKVDMGLRRYGLPWPPPSRFEEEGVGRGEAYRLLILFGELAGILGICRFPLQAAEGENLDLDMLSRLTTTLTGLDLKPQDLLKISERVYNLKRCFNVREGVDRRSDKLPRRMMEPIASGPTKGIRVENLDGMLDEFYDAMGWDRETGIPRREKLVELGLGDVAEEVWRSRPSKQEK
ncbi:MAG: aldehyde ferredoxin oxidoreductase [Candidatus Wolframiiraptor sp. EX4484-121]|nr:MAG: aldehyde ferredoxin oxidoreductase [Candidatus Wolframiiraptor sp. EX4484-121]